MKVIECGSCGKKHTVSDRSISLYSYCPHCGDMGNFTEVEV